MATDAFEALGLEWENEAIKDLFFAEVKRQDTEDAAWFQRTKSGDQYPELAKRVQARIESLGVVDKTKLKEAKEEHRKEAGGMMGSGGKAPGKTTKAAPAGEVDESMRGAMLADRKQSRERGSRFTEHARAGR